MKTRILFSLMLICAVCLQAQRNRYYIQFTDKKANGYKISEPSKFLTQASIERRVRYNISVHESDLPVTGAYVGQVSTVTGVKVHYTLKWFNGVVVSFDTPEQEAPGLQAIEAFSFVESQSKVRRVRHMSPAPPVTGENERSSSADTVFDYGGSARQAEQLNVVCLHNRNYRGQGMVIAVLDAGFANIPSMSVFDSLRAAGRLLGTRDFVNGGTNVYSGGDHGTMVLSCLAALEHGKAIGTAPLASYWLMRTEEGGAETISEEYNWIRGAEFADSVGADILTTSLGYTEFNDPSQNHTHATLDGRTAPMSIAATTAARKGMFVLNSAGNDGDKAWRKIGVAADADSICSVGAVDGSGVRSAFSSMGPTADNRIKPDLMARGEQAWVCTGSACFPGNGTSFSCPVLAGAVACYWQANRDVNNIEILRRLKSAASLVTTPDTLNGWGIPNMCDRDYSPFIGPPKMPAIPDPYKFEVYTALEGFDLFLPPSNYEKVYVRLIDMYGKLLYQGETAGIISLLHLPAPPLQEGVYIISVETSEGTAHKKILKLSL